MTPAALTAMLALAACGEAKVELGGDGVAGNGPAEQDTAPATDSAEDTSTVDTDDDTASADDSAVEVVVTIDAVTPATGSTDGGDAVVLTGGPFAEGSAVTFGASPATVTAWTETTLAVLTPAHPGEETVDVVVVTEAGATTFEQGFTYVEPCGGITASPSSFHVENTGDADLAVTLTGCATGVVAVDQMYTGYDGTPYGVEWLSVPSEVDGAASATLRFHYWSRFTPSGSYYPSLSTDQGTVTVEVDPT